MAIGKASAAGIAEVAAAVNRLLAQGALPGRIADVLPLRDAAEAHRRLETGEPRIAPLTYFPGHWSMGMMGA